MSNSPRKDAIAAGATTYEGYGCKIGHSGLRYTKTGKCVGCQNNMSVSDEKRSNGYVSMTVSEFKILIDKTTCVEDNYDWIVSNDIFKGGMMGYGEPHFFQFHTQHFVVDENDNEVDDDVWEDELDPYIRDNAKF